MDRIRTHTHTHQEIKYLGTKSPFVFTKAGSKQIVLLD